VTTSQVLYCQHPLLAATTELGQPSARLLWGHRLFNPAPQEAQLICGQSLADVRRRPENSEFIHQIGEPRRVVRPSQLGPAELRKFFSMSVRRRDARRSTDESEAYRFSIKQAICIQMRDQTEREQANWKFVQIGFGLQFPDRAAL
jgi:hypothetical protein